MSLSERVGDLERRYRYCRELTLGIVACLLVNDSEWDKLGADNASTFRHLIANWKEAVEDLTP